MTYFFRKSTSRALAAVILLAAVIAAGCSSQRKAATTTPAQTATGGSPVMRLAAAYASGENWTDFYAPFSLKVSSPMGMSVSGRATMVRDSSILLSLRMLGIEMAQLYIDNDSARFVDKYHRCYCSVPTPSLTAIAGITLGNLQDLMLGRAFIPGRDGVLRPSDESLMIVEKGDNPLLRPRKGGRLSWVLELLDEARITSVLIDAGASREFSMNYSDDTSTPIGRLPRIVSLEAEVGKLRLDARVTWSYDKLKINSGNIAPWTAPSGYRQLSPADFIDMLKSM
ncbi:MAG: DUF4292 domain-containing protein [Muribaculaceae bacterium]|nr:DUF4292 domain-containing protein [Muribaculaceae bacterium]